MTVIPFAELQPGRKGRKTRDLAAFQVQRSGWTYLDWKTIDVVPSIDLRELVQTLSLTPKPAIDFEYVASQLSFATLEAYNLACVEAALESNALLAKRYRGISDDISAALVKLHYPPISQEPNLGIQSEYTRTSLAVEYLKPKLLEVYGFDGCPTKEVSAHLASIGVAARTLAANLEMKATDLAALQWRDFHPNVAGQSMAKQRYTASDILLFWFLFAFCTSFEDPAKLTIDGVPNEQSIALIWCKNLLDICISRLPICLETPSPAVSSMLKGISQIERGGKTPKAKKATSLAARLSKIYAWVNRALNEISDSG